MPVCCIGVHLSGLKGFIVLRCHIATESKEDRRLFKVHESRGSMKKEKKIILCMSYCSAYSSTLDIIE